MSKPEKYRHEWKYLIDTAQKELICQIVSPFLELTSTLRMKKRMRVCLSERNTVSAYITALTAV